MPKLIDLGDVLAVINASMLNLEYTDENRAMQKAISMLPTIDAIEVVHCDECRWCKVDGGFRHCMMSAIIHPTADDYCSLGERKDAEIH
jgi:hypothetical protein